MNELLVEFRGKDLPSKKKEYVAYTDEEWDDLAKEKKSVETLLRSQSTAHHLDLGVLLTITIAPSSFNWLPLLLNFSV